MKNTETDWEPKDGLTFDDRVMSIIKGNKNISILAGPGAGKTEILAQRACFLLETNTSSWPKNILAITRKRESATNIKSRVVIRCGKDLAFRFHSYTIEAFTKSLLDRFMNILPENQRPKINYNIEFDSSKASFPNSLSFDQITQKAHDILIISPALLKIIRATYSHVFIDEFQDINEIQYNIIKLLFSKSTTVLSVVGDTKQSIMRFANALHDVFSRFNNDFETTTISLFDNYRSSKELKYFLDNLGEKWWPSENSSIISKNLPNQNYSIHCYQNDKHESQELAIQIHKWIFDDKIPPNEIAILLRINSNNNYSKHITESLSSINILSINETSLQDHLSEPIGKILISLLILFTRQRDASAWEILLDLYSFSMSNNENEFIDFQILKIIEYINTNKSKFDDLCDNTKFIVDLIYNFIDLFFDTTLEITWPQYSNDELLIITISGIINELGIIKKTGTSWKESVDIISGINAVRIMTIHKCKGLEFEAVILLGFEDYSFFRFGSTPNKIKDVKSTIFVALSRAKNKLLISASKERSHYGNSSFSHIKQFIEDLSVLGLYKKEIKSTNNN